MSIEKRRRFTFKTGVLALILLAGSAATLQAQAQPGPYFQVEQGALKLLKHTYRVGAVADGNDDFDFVAQGGQEILSFFERYTAGIVFGTRHDLSFLYQPLELVTNVRFKDSVQIDDVTFATGTPMKLTYSFPFYRITYRYNLLSTPTYNLGVGAALQMRNASIRFEDLSGAAGKLVVSQNLGPVPALSLAGRTSLGKKAFIGFEATGSYASSALFNGANFTFEGSVLDASIRGGYVFDQGSEAFANLRFFGGTANGISQYPDVSWAEADSNETSNIIATLSLTFGGTVRLR
ncbi:MAG TPA: hypothetical protein VIO60_10565 [Rectinemataceae bacterium]